MPLLPPSVHVRARVGHEGGRLLSVHALVGYVCVCAYLFVFIWLMCVCVYGCKVASICMRVNAYSCTLHSCILISMTDQSTLYPAYVG